MTTRQMTTRHVITLNAGSSSIKFALYEFDNGGAVPLAVGLVEHLGGQNHLKVRSGQTVTHAGGRSSSGMQNSGAPGAGIPNGDTLPVRIHREPHVEELT